MSCADTVWCKYPSLDAVWCNTDNIKALKRCFKALMYSPRICGENEHDRL